MLFSVVIMCALTQRLETLQNLPFERHGLRYTQPAVNWDEAFPLGNGILGALVWGDGFPLNISLDRTDLWDLRPVPEFYSDEYSYALMRQWEKEGNYDALVQLYEQPYHRPAPTKIPAGRIEIRLPKGAIFREAYLPVRNGVARLYFGENITVQIWIHTEIPVGIIQIEGSDQSRITLKAPPFAGKKDERISKGFVMGDLSQLGYDPPIESEDESHAAFRQQGWGGFSFAVHLTKRHQENATLLAWSIASSFETPEPESLARSRAEAALDDLETLRKTHDSWWNRYWQKGWISIPDPAIEHQYYMDMYKFGAAARRSAPPITLQGPWTADDGKLPPWKGDYHHDLNTQLSYWPCYSGNRLEEGLGFLDWLWENRPQAEAWTRRFFDMPGLNVPMTTDIHLNQIGGWRQYTHSATTGAWLAHHFYLHWLFSQDREFLETRAYPWLEACAIFLEAITRERDSDGSRTLPLSSSPEINDNRPEAWFPTITNYDNALIRWTFEKTAELAIELGDTESSTKWRTVLTEMPPIALAKTGGLAIAKGFPLKESHRHFSHVMAFHPLAIIHRHKSEEDARIIEATLADLQRLGSQWWTGYSFSWLASLAAWAGNGDAAVHALTIFANAFVLRNSFHCNGDQSGKGYSNFTYSPFTLEGNFAFAAAVHELLLQSHAGFIEIFPAIPTHWESCAFSSLRAAGAFLVSASRENNQLRECTIISETGKIPIVRCPWTGRIASLDSTIWQEVALVEQNGRQWQIRPRPTSEG